MDIRIVPGPIRGTVEAPASKSELHRYLICAGFADGCTVIEDAGEILPDDIKATVSCLEQLGASFSFNGGAIAVTPSPGCPGVPAMDCAGSGSTLRFLLPAAAALCSRASFSGNGNLAARPVSGLISALEDNGAAFSGDKLPFEMDHGLEDFMFSVPGNISSQYVSGLLIAGALSPERASVRVTTELGSAGYVDMTAEILRQFGTDVGKEKDTYHVSGPLRSPGKVRVRGSWSAAAGILAVAACQKDSDVTVTGLDPASSQGDRAVLGILRDMGADISTDNCGIRVRGSELSGIQLDVDQIPDLFPVLAAASAGAGGTSVFRNGYRLRLKESDRLDSVRSALTALGISCREINDGLEITGRNGAHSGEVPTQSDHRIVMAAAVAAYSLGKEAVIRGTENVNKSYPGFFDDLMALGGEIHVL